MNNGLTNISILLAALKTATPINACRVAERADRIEGCPLVLAKHHLMNERYQG